MSGSIHLNANNLSVISENMAVPEYDRTKLKTGIVHVGVGNFHRSHEAYYTDEILHHDGYDWGICGIGLLEKDQKMSNILKRQDGLYTLMVLRPEESLEARVIGSIVEYLFAPENPEKVFEKMAAPEVKIISLTITEGGYNYNSDTGSFRWSDPLIQWDLSHPDNPKTIFGYLVQALKHRKNKGLSGLTILSCDNIQKNGYVCRQMLTEYIKSAEPELFDWVNNYCSFPNSMVDRITPVTTKEDIEKLNTTYGIIDEWPVTCEPFIQWVIEDDFTCGRPEWERAGVQFVDDVEPYERMKIRLLNAGHSLLGFAGTLYGYKTIDETVRDPLFETYLRNFMDNEVTPVLGKIEGINIDEYKDSLVERFGNSNIKDQLSRICSESSDKIPKFLLPTLREQLHVGGPIKFATLIIATWCRYLELAGAQGFNYDVQDPMKDEITKAALASQNRDSPLAFLKIRSVFGDLATSNRFTETYFALIQDLRNSGIGYVVKKLTEKKL